MCERCSRFQSRLEELLADEELRTEAKAGDADVIRQLGLAEFPEGRAGMLAMGMLKATILIMVEENKCGPKEVVNAISLMLAEPLRNVGLKMTMERVEEVPAWAGKGEVKFH